MWKRPHPTNNHTIPQHTIPNETARKLTQTVMGKKQNPNLYMREKNSQHSVCTHSNHRLGENNNHGSTMNTWDITQTKQERQPKKGNNLPTWTEGKTAYSDQQSMREGRTEQNVLVWEWAEPAREWRSGVSLTHVKVERRLVEWACGKD